MWSAPDVVVKAAYFHSIYSTVGNRTALAGYQERDQLRSLIGTQAERIVYLFTAMDRRAFFSRLSERRNLGSYESGLKVPNRDEPSKVLEVHRDEVLYLLILYAASIAEQTARYNSSPAPWLADLSTIATLIDAVSGFRLPFYSAADPLISKNDEAALLRSYCSIAQFRREYQSLGLSKTLESWIGELWAWRSFWLHCEDRIEEALTCASRATGKFKKLGTAWDKRLSLDEWLFVAKALQCSNDSLEHAKEHAELIEQPQALHEFLHHRIRFPAKLRPALSCSFGSACSPQNGQLTSGHSRVTGYLADFGSGRVPRQMGEFPQMHRQPVWDTSQFPLVQALEASAEMIMDEVSRLNNSLFHDEAERIEREGAWDVFMLFERGRKHLANCSRCPVTTSILERYDTMRTVEGLIYVSKMRPHTRIKAHRGPTNLRLRCHLGLEVPTGDCGIRVGHEQLKWISGKCIVFDDFFEHDAWNNTDSDRVVLIVDLWHPNLTEEELCVLKGLHHYVYMQAESLQRYWAANESKALKRRVEYD
jgi:aspartate beta-hydroxylase